VLQPDISPISQEQLAAEVKGIYAGLVMVEAKCFNIDAHKKAAGPGGPPLTAKQWQALVTLHRTLLYEHHDFLLATQHPSANPALLGLATKYSPPARTWKHGIHAFLEFLRHRRPDSQHSGLGFILIAYQMISLLLETAPGFTDTWIECLGDLARYRMAVEDEKGREMRTTAAGMSASWYAPPADRHPMVERLYHHVGVLERPSLRKFRLYWRALMSVVPSSHGTWSLGTLCSPGMCSPLDKLPSTAMSSSHDTPLFHDTTLPTLLGTSPGGPNDCSKGSQLFDSLIVSSECRVQRPKSTNESNQIEALSCSEIATASESSLQNPPPDVEQATRFSLSHVSPGFLFDTPDGVSRLYQLLLDWLACRQQRLLLRLGQTVSVLKLAAALHIAENTPRACAAPIPDGPAHGIEAGLQTFWQITLSLAPLVIVVGGLCRLAWILTKHERPLSHPIWSGALSLIASTVWGVVRTAESGFTKEQACILAVYAAIWAESVAESSRMVNNRARYLLSVVLGGGLLTLTLLALDFVFALGNGQADSRSKYMTQAANKGPFLLTVTTLGIYICQKYFESMPTGYHHDAHELQALRVQTDCHSPSHGAVELSSS
jgi:hypothetical protein